jgi:hypothetical protein
MAFHRPGARKPTPPITKALKRVVLYHVRFNGIGSSEGSDNSEIDGGALGEGTDSDILAVDCISCEKVELLPPWFTWLGKLRYMDMH